MNRKAKEYSIRVEVQDNAFQMMRPDDGRGGIGRLGITSSLMTLIV